MAAASPLPGDAEPSLLARIRNMSEFAALMQYLFLFGEAVKAEDLDVEAWSLARKFTLTDTRRRISSRSASRPHHRRRYPNWASHFSRPCRRTAD
jgi:hypothetical protein